VGKLLLSPPIRGEQKVEVKGGRRVRICDTNRGKIIGIVDHVEEASLIADSRKQLLIENLKQKGTNSTQ
jgi:hypothetical protein